jgi:hypothetical protein
MSVRLVDLQVVALALGAFLPAVPALAAESFLPVVEASEPNPPSPAVTEAEAARRTDTASDHGLVISRARTLPAGALSIASHELVGASVTYGFTDALQLTVGTTLPIRDAVPAGALGSVKWGFAKGPDHRVAVTGFGGSFFEFGRGSGYLVGGGAGVHADFGLTESDVLVATVGGRLMAGRAFAFTKNCRADCGEAESDVHAMLEAGIDARVHEDVAFMFEVQLGASLWAQGFDPWSFGLVNYGARFNPGSVALDLGFVRPIVPEKSNSDRTGILALGYPVASLTYGF